MNKVIDAFKTSSVPTWRKAAAAVALAFTAVAYGTAVGGMLFYSGKMLGAMGANFNAMYHQNYVAERYADSEVTKNFLMVPAVGVPFSLLAVFGAAAGAGLLGRRRQATSQAVPTV